MKLLFIGGTGVISSACSNLAIERGHELFLLNRSVSTKYPSPKHATILRADIHAAPEYLSALLAGHHFDAVVDFIAFSPQDIERDISLFRDRTDQFVFISSASAYQKPLQNYLITEETPLENPFWEYSRNKIACEDLLMKTYRADGFPVTIIRPSHTYGPSQIPLCVTSWRHPGQSLTACGAVKKSSSPVMAPRFGCSPGTLILPMGWSVYWVRKMLLVKFFR